MSDPPLHLDTARLEAGLDEIRCAPADGGRLELIVARPRSDERVVLDVGQLDREAGLVGDCWKAAFDASGDPGYLDAQVTVMNARAAALVAGPRERWPLAGDQLYVDLDLSGENLPPGARLAIGDAVLEVTAEPHTGCRKFVSRFGLDAMKFVNSEVGRALNLRGINTRVVKAGEVRVGDRAERWKGDA
ncbi:MAG: MOSC domain-containing protein [Thermoanaerobaculia bacterium]|nr:MOSC domain-containing protein [Thermoanaerobaculia bacterium]